jgi:hypothetical protein
MERMATIASYLNTTNFIGKISSGKMHEKNLNAHRDFTPSTVVLPPNAITPKQVICHYRKAQER